MHWSWSILILTKKTMKTHLKIFFQLSAIAQKNSIQYLDYIAYVYMYL